MGVKSMLVREFGKDHSAHETYLFARRILGLDEEVNDGGPGSGNFGHKGRPGKVGGSGEGGSSGEEIEETGKSDIPETKTFQQIHRLAQKSKDYGSFIKSMDKMQKDALQKQWKDSGTEESLSMYARRMLAVMQAEPVKDRKENKVVQGKDISRTYDTWRKDIEPYVDPEFGQVIDTTIEDVIAKQGFNGVPKVVSQEEFDRIIKEHPEMPILYRSYAAETPEKLADYDEMLESGEWYVDCGTGGAQYGQGMYCAGVYQQEPLYKWDDPSLDSDFRMMHEMGSAGMCVFTDSKGNGFVTKDKIQPDDTGDMYSGIPYLIVNKDGSRMMIRMDEDSYLWTDMNTGALISDDDADQMVGNALDVYECKEQDLGIYADANSKEREAGIRGALSEMEHYRRYSIRRIEDENPGVAPEGKSIATGYSPTGNNVFMYFDKNTKKRFDDVPKEGMTIAVMYDYVPGEAKIYTVAKDGLLLSPDGRSYFYLSAIDMSDKSWAEIEGECERKKIDPQASTRVMTLDPSAKIITYQELRDLRHKITSGYNTCDMSEEAFVEEAVSRLECPDYIDKDLVEAYAKAYYYGISESPSEKGEGAAGLGNAGVIAGNARINRMKYNGKATQEQEDWFRENRKHIEMMFSFSEWTHHPRQPMPMDEGVCAAMLGYDAINAEGHGESGSYTVVLNRTKVILSEQKVRVEQ